MTTAPFFSAAETGLSSEINVDPQDGGGPETRGSAGADEKDLD